MEGEQPTQSAQTPIYQESQDKNAKWLWLLIALIIIAALVFAFFKGIGPFAKFRGGGEELEFASPSPFFEESTSPTPEATSQADVDRSQPKIRVLNGSGTAGIASAVKDFLEGKGWKVASIGNAQDYDFTDTEVRTKSTFSRFEKSLVDDLSAKYPAKAAGEPLESTDSADIEVIVGSK